MHQLCVWDLAALQVAFLQITNLAHKFTWPSLPIAPLTLTQLHKWIEPFAEMPKMQDLGCDYVLSIHQFLSPKPEKWCAIFKDVWPHCLNSALSDLTFLVLCLGIGVVS